MSRTRKRPWGTAAGLLACLALGAAQAVHLPCQHLLKGCSECLSNSQACYQCEYTRVPVKNPAGRITSVRGCLACPRGISWTISLLESGCKAWGVGEAAAPPFQAASPLQGPPLAPCSWLGKPCVLPHGLAAAAKPLACTLQSRPTSAPLNAPPPLQCVLARSSCATTGPKDPNCARCLGDQCLRCKEGYGFASAGAKVRPAGWPRRYCGTQATADHRQGLALHAHKPANTSASLHTCRSAWPWRQPRRSARSTRIMRAAHAATLVRCARLGSRRRKRRRNSLAAGCRADSAPSPAPHSPPALRADGTCALCANPAHLLMPPQAGWLDAGYPDTWCRDRATINRDAVAITGAAAHMPRHCAEVDADFQCAACLPGYGLRHCYSVSRRGEGQAALQGPAAALGMRVRCQSAGAPARRPSSNARGI